MTLIARWESGKGAFVAELHKAKGSGFYYRGDGCGGYLGNDISLKTALRIMRERCKAGSGYFQPDTRKRDMQQVSGPTEGLKMRDLNLIERTAK